MKPSTMYAILATLIVILILASTDSLLYGGIAAVIFYVISVIYRSLQDQLPVQGVTNEDEGDWEVQYDEPEDEVSISRDAEFEVIPPINPETNNINLAGQGINADKKDS